MGFISIFALSDFVWLQLWLNNFGFNNHYINIWLIFGCNWFHEIPANKISGNCEKKNQKHSLKLTQWHLVVNTAEIQEDLRKCPSVLIVFDCLETWIAV